ncbi:MAG: DUF3048 domain-containing protein [Anaerolineales bacterium]
MPGLEMPSPCPTWTLALVPLMALVSACSGGSRSVGLQTATASPSETPLVAGTASRTPRPTLTPSATPEPAPVGPDFEEGFNPLTGLPLRDADTLALRPLLIAITNFPPSARPQAGLSVAAQVWETSIGQGMTRFLAVYYGDFLSQLEMLGVQRPPEAQDEYLVGPVRSGRIAFEAIKTFYPGAFLLTHSASEWVREQLTNRIHVPSDDPNDVNSAGLTLEELRGVAQEGGDPRAYAGLVFDYEPPSGGEAAGSLNIFYNLYNQVRWEYDRPRGAYRRLQNTVEDTGLMLLSRERIDGSPWTFENVVVLFAGHRFVNPDGSILEIELLYAPRRFGLLLRDGRRYRMEWSSLRGDLQLRDEEGEVLPLRPGRTFFEVVSLQSTWDEQANRVRFHAPLPPTPTETPTPTPTRTPSATQAATAPGP